MSYWVWTVFVGFVVLLGWGFHTEHPPAQPVGTPLYLSDVMEYMTEPEADALMRAVQAARG